MSLRSRLINWVLIRLAPHGLTWFILAGIATILTLNIDKAAWIPDSSPITNAVWFGLLVGTLVSYSRFSGGSALIYHATLGFLSLGLWIGKVVPPLSEIATQATSPALQMANIRIFSYLDRFAGWAIAIFSGSSIQDNGLFQLFIGFFAWGCAAWLSWAVFRRGKVFEGLLPAGLLLGINTYLSAQPVDGLWSFLGCGVILAVRVTYQETIRDWERRQVDYPDELGWGWAGSALTLGIIILLVARLSPWVGTPEGWKTVRDLLRDAQKRLENTTTRLFGDVAPPPPQPEEFNTTIEPYAPRAETPEMGVVGPVPYQSSAVVMWVKTSDPPPPEIDPGMPVPPIEIETVPIHYWRGNVFGKYSGIGWEELEINSNPPDARSQLPEPKQELADSVDGRYLLTQEFEIIAGHDPRLFAAAVPAVASNPENSITRKFVGPDRTPLVFGSGTTRQYSVQSWATAITDVQLRATSTLYPSEITSLYLQLPTNLPQRVRDLSRRVIGDAIHPFDKAIRLQDYLRLSYPYNLQVPLPPDGRDVVDYFLFDSPGGFCSYYSSALAVMLRSLGIPARVASGYATGSFDYSRQAYRVTLSNAHAWTEVYFPEYGWVEFEPTAGLARLHYETAAGTFAITSPLPPRPTPPAPAWQSLVVIAAAILIPILLFGLAFWLRTRRRKIQMISSPALDAEKQYLHLRFWLAWARLPAHASTTPNEYLQATSEILQRYGTLFEVLERATMLYQQAAYSDHTIAYAQIIQISKLSQSNWASWIRLFFEQYLGRILNRLNRSIPR